MGLAARLGSGADHGSRWDLGVSSNGEHPQIHGGLVYLVLSRSLNAGLLTHKPIGRCGVRHWQLGQTHGWFIHLWHTLLPLVEGYNTVKQFRDTPVFICFFTFVCLKMNGWLDSSAWVLSQTWSQPVW